MQEMSKPWSFNFWNGAMFLRKRNWASRKEIFPIYRFSNMYLALCDWIMLYGVTEISYSKNFSDSFVITKLSIVWTTLNMNTKKVKIRYILQLFFDKGKGGSHEPYFHLRIAAESQTNRSNTVAVGYWWWKTGRFWQCQAKTVVFETRWAGANGG